MVLKEKIRFDKENLPPYIFKYNVATVVSFAAWFVVCLPVIIAVGLIYGESVITYVIMGGLLGVFFIELIVLIIVAMSLRKRFIEEKAVQFKNRYPDMPLDEAERILKEKQIITDEGYFGANDVFGRSVIPFDKAGIGVYVSDATPLKVEFGIYIYLCEDGETYGETHFNLNTAFYNFLKKRGLNECVTMSPETPFLFSDDTGDLKNIFNLVFGFRVKKYSR